MNGKSKLIEKFKKVFGKSLKEDEDILDKNIYLACSAPFIEGLIIVEPFVEKWSEFCKGSKKYSTMRKPAKTDKRNIVIKDDNFISYNRLNTILKNFSGEVFECFIISNEHSKCIVVMVDDKHGIILAEIILKNEGDKEYYLNELKKTNVIEGEYEVLYIWDYLFGELNFADDEEL